MAKNTPKNKGPIKRGTGLKPLPDDKRDLRHDVVFGSPALADIPKDDFYAGHPIVVKDQGALDFCPAYAAAAVVEDEVGVELDPLYLYAQGCKLLGEVQTNGMSLRDICAAVIKKGTIEESMAPYKLGDGHSAEFYANPINYPESLDPLAWEYARISYWRVDLGPYDTFDNICTALYQNLAENRSVLTGAKWRQSWTDAPNGVISSMTDPEEPGFGHAFKVFGVHYIKGIPHLIIQGSYGPGVGDQGLFYMPRSVVNREFVYGAFNFKNLAPAKAAFYSDHGLNINATVWQKVLAVVGRIFTSYLPQK